MASTTALYSGLSGLQANSRSIDVIGNNIANVNTTAFKSSRTLFASAISRTFHAGSSPSEELGGTNPYQVGLGVRVAGTQRNFAPGAVNVTGNPTDLAIDGQGFFITRREDQTLYTRDGAFNVNENGELVSISGERLQGFGVDDEFSVVDGVLTDLTIPVGLTLAEATTNARLSGNLNAAGELPTGGAQINFAPLMTIAGFAGATTTLADLVDINDPTATLISVGQTIELNGARKGDASLPVASLAVEAGTTLQDLADFLIQSLGINPDAGPNPDGTTPGATIDPATGVLSIISNSGSVNDIDLESSDLRILNAAGGLVGQPFETTEVREADGESVRTTFIAYDSLGAELTVNLTMTLETTSDIGTTWRYFAESIDDTEGGLAVGTGLVQFDTVGRLVTPANATIQIDRDGTGAADPLTFNLDFDSTSLTSFAARDVSDSASSLIALADGTPIGFLSATGIAADGFIEGTFTNGLTRTLGRVALATFANPEGLVDDGGNFFKIGPNSGSPAVQHPLQFDAGLLIAGALEQSNVDLSEEFIDLILASTGYSASSRVITATDQLFQQLLVLGR